MKRLFKAIIILTMIWASILVVPILTIVFAFLFIKDWIEFGWYYTVDIYVESFKEAWAEFIATVKKLFKEIDDI
jgi:hypothetical protein